VANDDILAMFSAGEAQPSALDAAVPPASDPLGMFQVPPSTAPLGKTEAAPSLPPDAGSEPDILDMFGVVPAKPDGKEAK